VLELIFQYVLPSTLVAVIGGWFLLAGKRRDRATAEAAIEAARNEKRFPGWEELVDENRGLRTEMAGVRTEVTGLRTELRAVRRDDARRMQAVARILRALFEQWPGQGTPNLDPADIAEIEETIPPAWVHRRSGQTEGDPPT
jgi:hypothetical protein